MLSALVLFARLPPRPLVVLLGPTASMDYRSFIAPETLFYALPEPLPLEGGDRLEGVQVAYRTWGTLNGAGDNGVLICHAFTGSADADWWWSPLLGPGRSLDPERDFIICSNILGSCYGTTGPTSINPATGLPYGPDFPAITIRDMVRLQAMLLDGLGVRRLRLVIGGSLGGMQVLEWAAMFPDRVGAIAPMAISGRHSAWCIGWSEAQRLAIYADPLWQGGRYDPDQQPVAGLAAARAIAMCTYRTWDSFEERFGRKLQPHRATDEFAMASYLRYQGDKLIQRFDANTYVALSLAMDRHDLARPDRDYGTVLGAIAQPALVVSIPSDVLYPPQEQAELARLLPGATLVELPSIHGHDAFLIELEALNDAVAAFRDRVGL